MSRHIRLFMHRDTLLNLLQQHRPFDATEAQFLTDTLAFVQANPACFERSLAIGHITGSAWIIDRTQTHTLLTHHRKLNRWFQTGGHCDGDPDVLAVARREAAEETGLLGIKPLSTAIFDIDVHLIPAKGTEPAHWHYDIRFLLEASLDEPLVISAESKNLAWVKLSEVAALNNSASLLRMVKKTTM